MSLALAAALLAASPAALPSCSWDRPGHNPFMGDVVAAVDRYPDIPAPVRARLKARMAERRYDEVVTIRRDSIDGKGRYSPAIRGMHFGDGQVCGTVSRARWTASAQERGLVYCEEGHCILVPTVCRNVSRIERTQAPVARAEGPDAQGAVGGASGRAVAGAASSGGDAGGAAGQGGAGGAPGLGPMAPGSAEASPVLDAEPVHTFAQGGGSLPEAPVQDGGGWWPGGGGAGAAGGAGGSLGGAGGPGGFGIVSGSVGAGVAAAAGVLGAGALVGSGVPQVRVSTPNGSEPGLLAQTGLGTGGALPASTDVSTSPVPEPGTWALMASGLVLLLARARRLARRRA